MPGDVCARRSSICSKLVYNRKTRCIEGQMRNHTGNLHKESKTLPSSKARPNKARLRSTLEERVSFMAMRHLERGAKRLPTIDFFSLIWLPLSKPSEKSSWPDLTNLSSLVPKQKDVARTWMPMNGEIDLFVMKKNCQGYPWGRLCWKLSSAPHLQRLPHQLQILVQTFQYKCPGNTPDDQQAL